MGECGLVAGVRVRGENWGKGVKRSFSKGRVSECGCALSIRVCDRVRLNPKRFQEGVTSRSKKAQNLENVEKNTEKHFLLEERIFQRDIICIFKTRSIGQYFRRAVVSG